MRSIVSTFIVWEGKEFGEDSFYSKYSDVHHVEIRSRLDQRKPRSIEDLQLFLNDAFANRDPDLLTKMCHSMFSRCRECIEANSLQF
ncbi:Hypothetical predicted protein [Octopus vulgaris]|uniref:Uncharacterized protein n=1 Tax=Octopus vulgaris TaxID=6645 RepID=A0AA36EVX3_OCTVU|nr:Hypothetical predicted protein [Octopus vulgaris]